MKKGLFVLIVATLLFGTALPANADEGVIHAIVNGKSHHFDSSHDWNEDNFGLGIEYEFEQRSAWKKIVMVNAFQDSMDATSWMAGGGLHRRLIETDRWNGFHVYAGLNAFLMTREDINGGNPFPGVLPSITVGNGNLGLNLTYLPRKAVEEMTNANVVDPTLSGILFLQLKVNISQLLP